MLTGAVPLFTGVGKALLLGRAVGVGEAFLWEVGDGVGVSSGVAAGVSEGIGVGSGVCSGVGVGELSGVGVGEASGDGVGEGVGECFLAELVELFGFVDFERVLEDVVDERLLEVGFFFGGGGGPVRNCFTLPSRESSDSAAIPAVVPNAIAATRVQRIKVFIR